MNDKKTIVVFIVIFIIVTAMSFGAGCIFGYGFSVRQDRRADNEFREQLENKQREINELEIRLSGVTDVVRNVSRDIGGIVDGISEQIDIAVQQGGDIRATFNEIRKAVKELENRERYYRELANRLSNSERDTGE